MKLNILITNIKLLCTKNNRDMNDIVLKDRDSGGFSVEEKKNAINFSIDKIRSSINKLILKMDTLEEDTIDPGSSQKAIQQSINDLRTKIDILQSVDRDIEKLYKPQNSKEDGEKKKK